MKKVLVSVVAVAVLFVGGILNAADKNTPEFLQSIHVTVVSSAGQGSGTLITRKVDGENVNFVVGCGHVIDSLRHIREAIDVKSGTLRKIVEFADADVVQHIVEGGRKVGEWKMKARVIKYSDSELGDDLSLLMVRKKNLSENGAKFYLDGDKIVGVGTDVTHLGSLGGEVGSGSFMTGTISFVGRIIELNNGVNSKEFTQLNVGAQPGSSGGGVFLKDARLAGILVRGSGPSVNLMVPVSRMWNYFEKEKMEWVMDENAKVPTMKEILEIPVE